MKKSILCLLLGLSVSAIASTSNSDFNYNLTIKEDGDFAILVNERFHNQYNLKSVVYSNFLNVNNLKSNDESLISQTYSININNALKTNGKKTYKTVLKASRNNITATLENDCTLTVNDTSITNYCRITRAKAPIIGSLFKYGYSNFACYQKEDSLVTCKVNITGKPDSINMFVMKRSSERLAVSGAVQTLKTLFANYKLTTEKRKTNLSSDALYKYNISGLWSAMMEYFKDEQELDRTIKVKSHNNGYQLDTY